MSAPGNASGNVPGNAPGNVPGHPRIVAIAMPKWGMAMEEGTVTNWLVTPGSPVVAGAEIVEVESAKAAGALEAKGEGLLRRQLAGAGDVVPVGGLLGVIAASDVPEAEIDAFVAEAGTQSARRAAAAGPLPRRLATKAGIVNVLDSGAGDIALLLLHGFGGNFMSWALNQENLAASFRVVALDLPGHGDSDLSSGAAGPADLAASILAAMDALDLNRAHLAGHSLGGAVALATAKQAPTRVQSLTLIGSAGLGTEIDGSYIAGFLAAKRRKDLKPVIERLFHDPAIVTQQMLEDLVRMKRLDGVEAGLQRIAAAFFSGERQLHADLGGALADLPMPHLGIWGEQDRIIPARHAKALADSVVLPGAGHMVHMEQPDLVNRLIAEFVHKIEGRN